MSAVEVPIAVIANTKRFPADFPAAVADLVPSPPMHLVRAVPQLPSKRDDLANDELSNTTRVAEWRVEYCNAMFSGMLRVDLVGSYAEAPNNDQILSLSQDPSSQLGLGPYAYDVNIPVTISCVVVNWKDPMRYPTVFSLSTRPPAGKPSGR